MASRGQDLLKRSLRKRVTIKPEEKAKIHRYSDQDGLSKKFINRRTGYGVLATKHFDKGEFLLTYSGQCLTLAEAKKEEEKCVQNTKYPRYYMYHFVHDGKKLWLVNDSPTPNCVMRKLSMNNRNHPFLALFALKGIDPGEELVYDYNAGNLWWRTTPESDDDNADADSSSPSSPIENLFESSSDDHNSLPVEEKVAGLFPWHFPEAVSKDRSDSSIDREVAKVFVEDEVMLVEPASKQPEERHIVKRDFIENWLKVSQTDEKDIAGQPLAPITCKDSSNEVAGPCLETGEKQLSSPGAILETPDGVKAGKKLLRRPCLFCRFWPTDLRRHILLKHGDEERVEGITEKEKKGEISRKDRIKEFEKMRKEAILLHNKSVIAEKKEQRNLVLERHSARTQQVVMCNKCSGFFSSTYFYKHKAKCHEEKESVKSVSLDNIDKDSQEQNDEWAEVLKKMTDDEVSEVVKKDVIIKDIGQNIFESRKPKKKKEAKTKAKVAMRRLIHSGLESAIDIFKVKNLDVVKQAMADMCAADDKSDTHFKSGLMLGIACLLKSSVKVLVSYFKIKENQLLYTQVKEFLEVYSSPTYYAKIVSKAEYLFKEKRHTENRKPSALPDKDALSKLTSYLEKEIKSVPHVETRKEFVPLRKVLLSYLTALNARRGCETTWIEIRDYQQRNSWIQGPISETDKRLLEKFSIIYVMGKGGADVDVIVPKFCEVGLDLMMLLRRTSVTLGLPILFFLSVLLILFQSVNERSDKALERKEKEPNAKMLMNEPNAEEYAPPLDKDPSAPPLDEEPSAAPLDKEPSAKK